MYLPLSDEQHLLRDSARDVLRTACSSERLVALAESPSGHDADLWKQAAGLGWLGLAVAEEHGGLGLSPLDEAVFAEELGRSLFPGPFVSHAVLASQLIGRLADRDQAARLLPRMVDGSDPTAVAVWDDRIDAPEGLPVTAERDGTGWKLSGTLGAVVDAAVATSILLPTRVDGGRVGLFAVTTQAGGCTLAPTDSLDLLRRNARLDLDGVTVDSDGLVGTADAATIATAVLEPAAAFLAAESIGGAAAVVDRGVAFAKERHQFGRPIGAFQAVAHRLAAAYVGVEHARSLVYAAAEARSSSEDEAGRALSMAKLAATDAFRSACEHVVQAHGAIGYTWEAGLHLYYRRARASEHLGGSTGWHERRIAAALAR